MTNILVYPNIFLKVFMHKGIEPTLRSLSRRLLTNLNLIDKNRECKQPEAIHFQSLRLFYLFLVNISAAI